MNIALVDDMPRELTRLSAIINEYAETHNIPTELSAFKSAEDFLAEYRPFRYTLIFMDIYMDGMTGVEAAEKIRENDNETLIVFLTTSVDHTFDAFKVHAYQYIIKDPDNDKLKSEMNRILDDIVSLYNLSEAGITVSIDGDEKTFPFSSIVCVQNEKNYIKITDKKSRSFLTRMTFSGIHSLLENDSRFLQINRGIIINMDYIDTFDKNTCKLHGGHSLPINVREQKKLDQIRKNYIFSKLHNRRADGGMSK